MEASTTSNILDIATDVLVVGGTAAGCSAAIAAARADDRQGRHQDAPVVIRMLGREGAELVEPGETEFPDQALACARSIMSWSGRQNGADC